MKNLMVTIRPNLNNPPHTTIHKGTLGKKLDSVESLSIECVGYIVRESGVKLLLNKQEKSVHAGLLGYRLDELVEISETSKKITYSPTEKMFLVEGKELLTPCTVTAINGVYYVI